MGNGQPALGVLSGRRPTISGMKADDVDTQTLEWDDIVAEHSARVYRLAFRLTGNRQDAEDLTQDVFIRVFRSLDTYEPGNFNGWIHRITTNLFLDRVRRSSRLRMDAFTDGAEDRLLGRRDRPRVGRATTPPSTRTSRRPSPHCRRSSASRSCSATSKGCRTRRSPPSSASSSAPCDRGSTAAAPSCATRSPTGPPGVVARDSWGRSESEWRTSVMMSQRSWTGSFRPTPRAPSSHTSRTARHAVRPSVSSDCSSRACAVSGTRSHRRGSSRR